MPTLATAIAPMPLVYARSAHELAPEQILPYEIMVYCYGELREFERMHLDPLLRPRRKTKRVEPEYLLLEASGRDRGRQSIGGTWNCKAAWTQFAEAGTISGCSSRVQLSAARRIGARGSAGWSHAYDVRDPNLADCVLSDRLLADRFRSPGEERS